MQKPTADAESERTPPWAEGAGGWEAFWRGVAVARTVPGWVLLSTSLGFGALARESGFRFEEAMFLTAMIYALPAQVVLVDQLARGVGLVAAAFALSLTAIRLLPMTVACMPYFRNGRNPLWMKVLAVHFIAITAWIEARRRVPHLPDRIRLPHFVGIGTGMLTATLVGTASGYLLAGTVPALVAATLLFMTPLYFLCSLVGTAARRADVYALLIGAVLGPALFVVVPGFDLMITGLVGGTIAWVAGRKGAA